MNGFTKWAIGGVMTVAVAGGASAQTPATTVPTTPTQHPLLKPVGTRLPQAVPSVGTPIGMIPGGKTPTLDPGKTIQNSPKPPGQVIDLANVVSPYPGQPTPKPTFWQDLERRWFSLFQSEQPAQRMNYTPGIARRNEARREAREGRWQRD